MKREETVRITLLMPVSMLERVEALGAEMSENRSTTIKMLVRTALQNEDMKKAIGLTAQSELIKPKDKGGKSPS